MISTFFKSKLKYEPQPPEPWTKVKKCGKEPPMPLQYNLILKVVHGAENCLFLNVYTPKIHTKELKPVMVWIYGGGFEMGGANRIMYGPDYFMQKDVVLVTINYRVGALGFLSLKNPNLKVPGNAGLKDQILGLQWVQANIQKFGGDPNNVTLFGESAGGASTHCLMLSPRTKGLFHKAILMSGTALTPWACKKDRQYGFRLAKLLGYSGANNDEEVFYFLKSSRGASLAAANGRILTEDEKREGVLFAHGPVVEPYETDQCVIPKDPMLLARETWSNKIPVIIGGCANEGYIFHFVAKKLDIKKLVGECELLIPECALDINKVAQQKYDHKILKQLYFGTKDASMMPLLEEPTPAEPWTEILDGTGEGPRPVQTIFNTNRVVGDENCLFLNVYSKEVKPEKLKPVIVWIHGGGFVCGSASKDSSSPDYFMSKDVVFASIAYRLGLFGFLSMKDPTLKVPGNNGLKDQVLGLKWIQENIMEFGGNPDNVTIFGNSAGAASVHLLALSEHTKGLFHRIICMSGSAFGFWVTPPPKNWAIEIGRQLGYEGNDNEASLLKFLRNSNATKLAEAENNILTSQEKCEGYMWCSHPVIEPYVTDQCIFAESPVSLAKKSWSNQIPMIIGCTSREGILFSGMKPNCLFDEWKKDPSLMLPFDLKTERNIDRCRKLGERLRMKSFGEEVETRETYIDEPEPPEKWTEVLDCTEEGSKPVQCQYITFRVIGSENCLFINVYTKQVAPVILRPVIVWIHGGGFLRGSTSKEVNSPDYFMSKDIVFVSVAYRLGIFGFLSMPDPSLKVPGNAGLKDQIFGLQWIQENIKSFGGDPNNVTILGESAGAASVHFLSLSERTKGLFHRMIFMSGSAFCNWASPPVKNWSLRLAKQLGYNSSDKDVDILQFLRSVDCRKIANVEKDILSSDERHEGYPWCSYPVIEPYVTEQCVISRNPNVLARGAWSNAIPMIAGCTSREGLFFHDSKPSQLFNAWESKPSLLLPFDLKNSLIDAKVDSLGQLLKQTYFEGGNIIQDSYIDFISYKWFWHPVHRMVRCRQKYATAPTYLYVFEFDSPKYSLLKNMKPTDMPGVSHADDLGYLFVNVLTPEAPNGTPEQQVTKQLISLWTQFALTANPNCDEIKPVIWEPVNANELPHKCLRIGKEIACEENPFGKMLAIWDALYDEGALL